jgi:hypothetical protein
MVSLHYWDWNEDPSNTLDIDSQKLDLFSKDFMGNSKGFAEEPWKSQGFYNNDLEKNYRSIYSFDSEHSNPADPPLEIKRDKQDGTLFDYIDSLNSQINDPKNKVKKFSDKDIINSVSYPEMRIKLEHMHNLAHSYIGGTIGNSHTSFRDPFVFLIHSNVDRLFAAWQLQYGHSWRLDPQYIYGSETNSKSIGTPPEMTVGIQTLLSPWCGMDQRASEYNFKDVRPWASPDNWHKLPQCYPEESENINKNSLHPTVVEPSKYDDMYELNAILKKPKVNLCGSLRNIESANHHV